MEENQRQETKQYSAQLIRVAQGERERVPQLGIAERHRARAQARARDYLDWISSDWTTTNTAAVLPSPRYNNDSVRVYARNFLLSPMLILVDLSLAAMYS